MIKYVLIILWFNYGQVEKPLGTGNAFVNYFDTMQACMAQLGNVPEPNNPDIQWWSAQCVEAQFNSTMKSNWPWVE